MKEDRERRVTYRELDRRGTSDCPWLQVVLQEVHHVREAYAAEETWLLADLEGAHLEEAHLGEPLHWEEVLVAGHQEVHRRQGEGLKEGRLHEQEVTQNKINYNKLMDTKKLYLWEVGHEEVRQGDRRAYREVGRQVGRQEVHEEVHLEVQPLEVLVVVRLAVQPLEVL